LLNGENEPWNHRRLLALSGLMARYRNHDGDLQKDNIHVKASSAKCLSGKEST
jgi:hypothetical protein